MAYMAPEVVHTARTGYTWHIDWWSLGVCAHELLWHKRPFHGKTADRMRESITSHPIKVPPAREGVQPVSKEGCDAILGVRRPGSTPLYHVTHSSRFSCWSGTRIPVWDAAPLCPVSMTSTTTLGSHASTGRSWKPSSSTRPTYLTCVFVFVT